MITNARMAEILTAKLNTLAEGLTLNGRPFQFLIHSNIGDYEHSINGTQRQLSTILINGVLGAQTSTPLPLLGLGSVMLMQSLTVLVPVDTTKTTGSADYALNLLTAFAGDVAGLVGTEQDEDGNSYSYVLSVSTPYVGQEDYHGAIGKSVPAVLQVSWQFIENGVLANNVRITLNGTNVVLLDGVITKTRVGDSVNVDGSTEMQTAITQQGLLWRVVMPYKRGDVSQTLMHDLLFGELETTYTLTYDDRERDVNGDLLANAQGLYGSWEVVAKEISTATTAGKNITLTATFVLARTD